MHRVEFGKLTQEERLKVVGALKDVSAEGPRVILKPSWVKLSEDKLYYEGKNMDFRLISVEPNSQEHSGLFYIERQLSGERVNYAVDFIINGVPNGLFLDLIVSGGGLLESSSLSYYDDGLAVEELSCDLRTARLMAKAAKDLLTLGCYEPEYALCYDMSKYYENYLGANLLGKLGKGSEVSSDKMTSFEVSSTEAKKSSFPTEALDKGPFKVIATHNFNDEKVADELIAENINEHYGNLICELLNDHHGADWSKYYRLVPMTHKLWRGIEDLI